VRTLIDFIVARPRGKGRQKQQKGHLSPLHGRH